MARSRKQKLRFRVIGAFNTHPDGCHSAATRRASAQASMDLAPRRRAVKIHETADALQQQNT
jgi:hypothetical protein